MNIYFREEIINLVEDEIYGMAKQGPFDFEELSRLVAGVRERQSQYADLLANRTYPPELKTLLKEIMSDYDLVNFWAMLDSRLQALSALVRYVNKVNTFLQKVQPHLRAHPDLTVLCLKMTIECDETMAQVLKHFHPIPEIHRLNQSARALRRALEIAAA